ncbi:hypothetical protein ACHAPX_004877 [Trichoderma viride]
MDSPPPAETLEWRTARITVRADRSWAVKANPNDPEQSTIGHEDGDDLVQPPGDGRIESLIEDQWCIVEVLPRGKTMYDNDKFTPQAAKRKRKKNLLDQISLFSGVRILPDEQYDDGFDLQRQQRWDAGERRTPDEPRPAIRAEPTVNGLYVGWSTYMLGPVFVRPVNAGDATPNVRHQASCANFEGTEFKVEPAGCVAGRQTIPHYLATMPGNLRAIKEFVNNDGKKFSTIFRFGSYSLKAIRQQTIRSGLALASGAKLVPVAKYTPLTNEQFEVASQNLEELSYPALDAGPHNPPWKDLICDGAILRRKTDRLSGFEYSVPFLKALSFPPKLILMLQGFALKFPNDLLTMEDLLLGLFAWYDIATHGYWKQESSVNEVRKGVQRQSQVWTVPYTSLCECLLGYPHYLRWTEEMCLAEYPHFSRYIHHIFKADRARDPLVVRGANLDETEVKRLMMQITSKVPGVTPSLRLRLLPHMMIGSRMPRMINIAPYIFPTKAQLAMTGLTSVYLKGLPTYTAHDTPREDTPLVKLCVPKRLAANSFIGNMRPLQGTRWDMEDFKQMKGELGLLTFPCLKAGPVWERDMDSMSQLFEDASESGPPSELLDPNWNLMDHLSPAAQFKYMHHQLHRMAHARRHGGLIVGQGHTLTIDETGFISMVGAPPITAEVMRQPTNLLMHGDQGRENLDAMIDQAIQPPPTEDAEPQGPCPLVEDVMRIIEISPARRHHVWSALYARLSVDQPDIPKKTSEGLLRAVIENIRQERAAWSRLALLSRNPRIEDLVLASPQILLNAICELAGIDTGDGETDPLSLLAEADEELEEWARDLEAGLERLALQANRIRTAHSDNMKQRRKQVLEVWTTVRGMLVQGKMEPRLRQLLTRLRDMQADSSDITLPEPDADDLELHTAHAEEGSSTASNNGNTLPLPSSSLDNNAEGQASGYPLGSLLSSADLDMEEGKEYLRALIQLNEPLASSPLLEGPARSNIVEASHGLSSMFRAPAAGQRSDTSPGRGRAPPGNDSGSEDRDYSSIKRQRLTNSPPDVKGKGLERPYSLYAAAQEQEDSKEVPRTVIDLTDLDDPPLASTAQEVAGPSTRQHTETLSRPPPQPPARNTIRRERQRRASSRNNATGPGDNGAVIRSPV